MASLLQPALTSSDLSIRFLLFILILHLLRHQPIVGLRIASLSLRKCGQPFRLPEVLQVPQFRMQKFKTTQFWLMNHLPTSNPIPITANMSRRGQRYIKVTPVSLLKNFL